MFQRKQTQLLILVALVLLITTLACGESASPTLVGQVTTEPSEEEQTATPTAASTTESPTENQHRLAPQNLQQQNPPKLPQ